jgi:hypothetical protein
LRVPIGIVKEGERNPKHWISVSGLPSLGSVFLTGPVAVDSSGNLYSSGNNGNFSNGFLTKFNDSGNAQFSATARQSISNFNQQSGQDIVADSLNNIYGIAWTTSNNARFSYFTKYNTSLQPQLSTRIIQSSPLTYFGDIPKIEVDSANNVIAFGTGAPNTDVSTDPQVYIGKFNSSGSLIWQRRFGDNSPTLNGNSEFAFPAKVTTDSSNSVYFLSGVNFVNSSYVNATTNIVKYDSSGNFQWKKKLDLSDQTVAVGSSGIATDSSNNVYVAVSTTDANFESKGAILKMNSAGQIQLQRFLGFGGISSMAISPDSHIYTTQAYQDGTVVSKFNLSLQPQWQLFLNEPGAGTLDSLQIKVSASGLVYLNGRRGDSGTSSPGYNYFQASLPADGRVYGSYLVGTITVQISKLVVADLLPSNIIEAALSTTPQTSSATVQNFQNPTITATTLNNYKTTA